MYIDKQYVAWLQLHHTEALPYNMSISVCSLCSVCTCVYVCVCVCTCMCSDSYVAICRCASAYVLVHCVYMYACPCLYIIILNVFDAGVKCG